MKKIIVIGAGVIGVTTAYFLRKKGYEVTVLDSAAAPGLGTSYANGAQLSYSKTHPLSDIEILKRLPKLLFSKDTPIHIHPGFDLSFLRWGMLFLRECAPSRSHHNAQAVLEIALQSRTSLHNIIQQHEIEFDYIRRGKMYIFRDMMDFIKTTAEVDEYNKHGFDQQVLDYQEAVALEPGLADMKGVKGVIYSRIDEAGDARKFTEELAKVCQSQGVEFIHGAKIDGFVSEKGRVIAAKSGGTEYRADLFVGCSGVESPRIFKQLGIYLPIYPMKGYSITVPATENTPLINLTDESARVVYSKIGDRLRIAGVAEFAGYDYKINRKIIEGMISAAKAQFPRAGDYSKIEEWTGLRPMTPSTVPIIGRNNKYTNLYFNTGHGMLGWTLACGSAEKLASEIES